MPPQTTICTEMVDLTEATIDTTERVLKNVILIRAGKSKNNKDYPEPVLRESAAIFEGIPAYDGHERRARRVGETTGWYKNVRFDNGALRADRYFSGTQAGRDVMSVAEDIVAGRAPERVAGLSINATGAVQRVKDAGGERVEVQKITFAESVDDVARPAAGGTYLAASASDDALAEALIAAMTFEEFTAMRPDFMERIRKEMQTARQDEAVKAAGEARQAALDEADQARTALTDAQEETQRLTEALEAAHVERDTARRELLVERTLGKVKLPEAWKNDLREKLVEADPDQWSSIVLREQEKAKVAGLNTGKVTVHGAEQQVDPEPAPALTEDESLVPHPNENSAQYLKRLSKLSNSTK